MVPNKFIGHGIVIGVWVLQPILFNFGWENTLYVAGIGADVHLLGHERLRPLRARAVLVDRYWSGAFLRCSAPCRSRSRGAGRMSRCAPASPGQAARPCSCAGRRRAAAVTAGSGAWYYYNAHVLNEYQTAQDRRDIQADYERRFKQYEMLPQPKVTAVDVPVDRSTRRRSFRGSGRFTLQNKGTRRRLQRSM
jgi:ABC-2 type transport system permease protein